jgi:hypothetical protein
VRQTRHNQSFLVRLTFGDLPEDEIAKGLASLTKLAMIAILELLEHAHGALNSGRRDDFFNRIGHGRINYGVEILFQQATCGRYSGGRIGKADGAPHVDFCGGRERCTRRMTGNALIGKRARLAADAFPSARLLFQFFCPATLKAVDYVARQFC